MSVRVAAASALFAVTLVIWSAPGHAQELPPEAQARIAQGEALFGADNYEGALVEFQAAYDSLEGNPDRYILLYNIGQCYERTFRYDRALAFYRRFQTEGGADAAADAEVQASIRALEGLLSTVAITTNVPRATVWVDGLEIATIEGSAEVRVAGGLHRVEVRAEGFASEQRELQTPARQRIEATFTLREISDYDGIDSAIFWTVSAVAVATAIAGVSLYVHVFSGLPSAMNADGELLAALRTPALVGDVLIGVAGAAAIGALVLAFVTDWDGAPSEAPATSEAPRASAQLVPSIGLDGFGAVLRVEGL